MRRFYFSQLFVNSYSPEDATKLITFSAMLLTFYC